MNCNIVHNEGLEGVVLSLLLDWKQYFADLSAKQ